MNKSELTDALAAKTNISKAKAGDTIDTMFDIISDTLAKGDKVQLIGFGTFEVADRAAKAGRNPRTGEATTIPAKRVPKFKAGAKLKAAVAK